MATDAPVATDAVAHLFDVHAQVCAEPGQFIDERYFGCQEGIGCVLAELGRTRGHHQDTFAIAHKRRVEALQALPCCLVVRADDDAIRAHEVVDGAAFLEKLRVARHLDGKTGAAVAQALHHVPGHALCGAHRHGRLVDHQATARQMAAKAVGHGQHVLQVGRAIFLAGRADSDEHHLRLGQRRLPLVAEAQQPLADPRLQQCLQPRFMDRTLALTQLCQALRVAFQAHHPVAHPGETGCRHQPYIPCPDHTEVHGRAP
ncbi:hypothetical protein D3C79_683630 [compost metagenome]